MKHVIKLAVVCGAALLYPFALRVLFVLDSSREYLVIVSWSFLFLMPLAFGALTTFLGYKFCGRSSFWMYGAPILTALFGLIASVFVGMEAMLCIVVASPIFLSFAFLGGVIMGCILSKGSGNLQISLLVLLPFAASPLEATWKQPHETVRIEDAILIAASPEKVWSEIVSVPAISSAELPAQWIYWLDFPRPISAEIDFHGLGARRLATFERDVSFFEIVTEWKPNERLGFSIEADPAFIPHTAFDQHIIVGGRFYDVLDGLYEIQPHPQGCRLVLTSRHRLSTPFNGYAGIWSRWVMNQIQGSILTVIKNRAERAPLAQTLSQPHLPVLARSVPR